jgi:hypothetical protein
VISTSHIESVTMKVMERGWSVQIMERVWSGHVIERL